MASVVHIFDYIHVRNLCNHKLQQSYKSTYNPYLPSQQRLDGVIRILGLTKSST